MIRTALKYGLELIAVLTAPRATGKQSLQVGPHENSNVSAGRGPNTPQKTQELVPSNQYPLTLRERAIATATVYGEARGQPFEGIVAVSWVIRNRAEISKRKGGFWWGNGVDGVCLKAWQFSCWNDGDPNQEKCVRLMEAVQRGGGLSVREAECLQAVELVFGGKAPDPTGGADHYFNPKVANPKWAINKIPITKIGAHVFYKLT